MKNSFKTPALYNLLIYLQEKYPAQKSLISSYMPKFADIDLSIYNHIQLQETYRQELNFYTKDTVYIVWNIDSIINTIKNTPNVPVNSAPIDDILILHKDFESVLSNVKQNFKKSFPHKLDSIIIGELPFFPGKTVIDGNHRLLEAFLAGEKNINYIYINPQCAIQFLQKDSQQFFLLLDHLHQSLQDPNK